VCFSNLAIKAAWDKFDLNGDGVVKTSEVNEFLSHLNIVLPEAKKQHIVKQLDRNGNGTIEFVEFVMSYEKGLFKNL
jgi:Ca2+-binding EF-hand superfamily protein